MIAQAHSSVLRQWRSQIATRRPDQRVGPRPLAALGYLTHGPVVDGLLEVDMLVLVVLYDMAANNDRWLRLAGFSGKAVPWGLRWGGPPSSKFVKDLGIEPHPGARGRRIDTTDADLLRLGLRLERQLRRCDRCRWLPVRKRVQLPPVWAGFRDPDATAVTGDGPELQTVCRRRHKPAAQVLEEAKRTHFGLTLYPLEWTSHVWQQAVALFADLRHFPQQQVFSLRRPDADLQGCQGAAEFDFLHSRFGQRGSRRRRRAAQSPRAASLG